MAEARAWGTQEEPLVLPVEEDSGEILTAQAAGGEAVAYCRRSPDKETGNEDTLAVIPLAGDTVVLAVADGAGGLPAGQRASRTAIRTVIESLKAVSDPAVMLRTAILNAMEEANAAVMALANGSATTLTVVSVEGRLVRPYHVGDSAALVTGQRGRLKMQTIAHTPVAFAVEAGFLDEVEALYHAERNLVFNFLGTADMRIEVGAELELAPRDTLLLASDGLTDNLHLAEIVEIARKGPAAETLAQLADYARERMLTPEAPTPSKPDDLSIILFRKPGAEEDAAAPDGDAAHETKKEEGDDDADG
ncbi:PP2C family protein-serine/threonine phosphatase [Lentisalinibacter orientalis]|uniref:PP2C family protein-serine/threonine phosphatase n=1 Tax=Lentisalinibacter orientalis TaxID=2992241 RepID=UPI003863868B